MRFGAVRKFTFLRAAGEYSEDRTTFWTPLCTIAARTAKLPHNPIVRYAYSSLLGKRETPIQFPLGLSLHVGRTAHRLGDRFESINSRPFYVPYRFRRPGNGIDDWMVVVLKTVFSFLRGYPGSKCSPKTMSFFE